MVAWKVMLPEVPGLTSQEARTRLAKFGPNKLPEKPPPSDMAVFASQLRNPLVYILIAAGIVTLALSHFSDSLIIFIAVFLNSVLGFIQERRAQRSLWALKQLVQAKAKVVREGKIETVDVEGVVVGDIAILEQGAKVPADGHLIDANRFFAMEAILTGESVPVAKVKGDSVFMGTVVSGGRAFMEVTAVGALTEIGKIAKSIQEPSEDTPLRRNLTSFSRWLTLLVLVLTLFVFVVGLISGRDAFEIFTTSVALAVSAIPEGLLVGLTVVLAIGMQRILRRKGLVRNLVSAETLGVVSMICADKTGTLTKGEMEVVGFLGDKQAIALQALVANDLDDPLVIAAYAWAKNVEAVAGAQYKRLDSIPFSPKERYFASLNANGKSTTLFVSGAPDFLIDWTDMSQDQKAAVKRQIDSLTREGKRLVGFARKELPKATKKIVDDGVKGDLKWSGILAFYDPVREGVREALEEAGRAGVRTLVITGDYPETAKTVMAEVGIELRDSEVVMGEELENMSVEELAGRLELGVKLFARTTPDQKLKIVQAFKDRGEVVAMMGDGVNDAPALKAADIGIVVGDASDVAKETADLVLLDSNFATIVAAIEEGRGIFDNIRKIILYLMSDAFGEIVAVVGSILLALPLPVTAVQILWINLVSDGFPDLALTVDPKRAGIMAEPPRSSKEALIAPWMVAIIGMVSLTSGLVALGLFAYLYKTVAFEVARSAAFLTLGVNSLVYVFAVRNLKNPFWRANLFGNRWLVGAVLMGLGLQIIPFVTPTTRKFFGVVELGIEYWLVAFGLSLLMFIIVEAVKMVFYTKHT